MKTSVTKKVVKKTLVKNKSKKRKPFEELSVKFQKKRIVKDAIMQIVKGIVQPQEGTYFSLHNKKRGMGLKEILRSGNNNVCEACAKGALFAGCIYNINEVSSTSNKLDKELFQKKKLLPWFSKKELDMIEAAFECSVIIDSEGVLEFKDEYSYSEKTPLGEACIKFGRKYKGSTSRLLAILNNILKYGSFDPYK